MHDRDAVHALTEAEDELLLQRMGNRETLNIWIDCGLTVRAKGWPLWDPHRTHPVAQKRLLGVPAREWGELEVQRVAQAVAALDGSGEELAYGGTLLAEMLGEVWACDEHECDVCLTQVGTPCERCAWRVCASCGRDDWHSNSRVRVLLTH